MSMENPNVEKAIATKLIEAGDLHSNDCCTRTEYGCDADIGDLDCCDNIRFVTSLLTEESEREQKLKFRLANVNTLLAATVWHLNNMDTDGNPTTRMTIPNAVYETLAKKMTQLPKDGLMTEGEALAIVRQKATPTPPEDKRDPKLDK